MKPAFEIELLREAVDFLDNPDPKNQGKDLLQHEKISVR